MPPSRSPYYLAIMILVFSLLSDLPHFNQCLIFTLSISLHYSKTFHGMHLPMVHISLLCRANLLNVACLGDPPFFFFFIVRALPWGSEGKASACNAGDPGSIPGSGRSLGEGNGSPLQYSCLENPMDGEAW